MFRRFLVSAALLTLVAAPVAAEDGAAFAPLKEEFLRSIGSTIDVGERIKLVEKVALYDNRDAAALLVGSIQILSDELDILLRKLDRAETEFDEVNSDQDLAHDGFKSFERLRDVIAGLDAEIAGHRRVVERIRKALMELRTITAQDYVAVQAVKGAVWRQRGICAHASALYPTKSGLAGALGALKDKEPRVVIQALYGLEERKDVASFDGVVKCLESDVWIVQTLAAETLLGIGSKKAVRPLIEALSRTTGRAQAEINDVIQKFTGENFEPDYEAWKQWYEEHKEEYEGGGAKPLAKGGKQKPSDEGNYYGVKTRSKRIVYVLDISGSMTLEIGGAGVSTPKEGEEERFSGPKIEVAKKELKRAIRQLPDDAFFNIITFNHLVKTWQPAMMQASQKNKNKAYIFIRDLKAKGGTYTYGALKQAFKLAGMGALDPNYETGVDTIFLLSDGAPTDNQLDAKLVDPNTVLEGVRDWNKLSKIVIHAIAIDPVTSGSSFVKFMKQLAEENGGQYLERN